MAATLLQVAPVLATATPFYPHCHSAPSDHFSSCAESHCCKDPHGFGCFRRPLHPTIAQCLPLSHATVNGVCVDSDQWLCPETWLQPPPPPSPPLPAPSPPPPSWSPMPPTAEPWHRCHGDPADHFASCMTSKCCRDPHTFGCFHKRHKSFAQCMPLSHQTPAGSIRCVDNDEWLCPSSWITEPPPPPPSPPPFHARCAVGHGPAPHFGSCLDSHCCADPRSFACFHKTTKHFAQCLPLSHMMQPDGTCHDTAEWTCPVSWLEPPPPPASPSPPPVIEGCVGTRPSAAYASCWESRECTPQHISLSLSHFLFLRSHPLSLCMLSARRLLQQPERLWLLQA